MTVEGVVVGDFQASSQLGGVFLQDADGDGDPATSDGLFVYAPNAPDVAARTGSRPCSSELCGRGDTWADPGRDSPDRRGDVCAQ